MVQRLLPFVSDMRYNRDMITDELTPWELTVTANDFCQALVESTSTSLLEPSSSDNGEHLKGT